MEERSHEGQTTGREVTPRQVLAIMALMLLVGLVIGQFINGNGTAPAAAQETAATPDDDAPLSESERDELNRLRQLVAQATECIPASPVSEAPPTPTPTSVPPVPSGTPIETQDGWTVTVGDIAIVPAIEGFSAAGKFAQMTVEVVNNGSESREVGFNSWILVDEQGRTYQLDGGLMTGVNGADWYRGIAPNEPKTFRLTYDVAADAGPTFTLENRNDPTYRIELKVLMRG